MARTSSLSLTGKAASSYLREFREQVQDSQAKEKARIMELCLDIMDILGMEAYQTWLSTTPDDNESFNKAVEQKLADLQSAIEAEKEAERGRELFRSDAEVQNDEDYNDLKRTQEEARM